MTDVIHLGFEVGTGKPVSIPLRHMVVTGQTQEAGKTTTMEALIARAKLPALAFVTKRGEKSFNTGRRIEPYFRERADWQFVVSVLEATMRERFKFERSWIMRACKGASTLADVHQNVRVQAEKAKGLSGDIYLQLDEYLKIVVPRVASVRFASGLDLVPGVNVLDMADAEKFPPELQSLVMCSALEWIYKRCKGTISIIPEAWEFLPQGRGSPVKLSAVDLIRKGAGLRNYVWLDSQDIGGIEKEVLRSCPVWLLGVQREFNEIKRVLGNIPHPTAKPKPSDVARLKKGEFYACFGDIVVKTYVQPAWMDDEQAIAIARGTRTIAEIAHPPEPEPEPEPVMEEAVTAGTDKKLDILIGLMTTFVQKGNAATAAIATLTPEPEAPKPVEAAVAGRIVTDEDVLYDRFKARLLREAPEILKVLLTVPELHVEHTVETIEVDGNSPRGRVARLILNGFFDSAKSAGALRAEMKRTGIDPGSNLARDQLNPLTVMGFFTREGDNFVAVPGMKTNIKKA